MADQPWAVVLTAEDGTLSIAGPFTVKHRAEHFAESVDGEAQAVMLESPTEVRRELEHNGTWAPPNSYTRRQRMLAAKAADPNRVDWSEYR